MRRFPISDLPDEMKGMTLRRRERARVTRRYSPGRLGIVCCAAFAALVSVSSSAVAQIIDAEEHRRPEQAPRVLAPPGTRTFVVALGTGHPAPNPNRFGPATAVVVDRTAYLVDAGEGIWRATAKAAVAHGGRIGDALDLTKRPGRVFLTHLHSDHTVGLPSLMLSPWSYGKAEPLEVWGPPGTKDMVSRLLEAYQLDIQNRVGRSSNDTGWRTVAHDVPAAGRVYEDDKVRIEAFRTKHANWEFSYAYRFTTPDRVVVVGGDGGPAEGLVKAVQGADVWLQEIMTEKNLPNAPWGGESVEEKERVIWGSHMRPSDLAKIATDANVKLLVLYHEQNYSDPYDPDALLKELRALGFEGAVVSSRDGDVF
jgi:ribonuclease Z